MVHGGKTVFYDGEKINDIGKRAHVMNHSHGRCVVGPFDKILHEGSIWTGYRAVLYSIPHKLIFLHFVQNVIRFYDEYITSYDRNKYIDDDRVGVSPKYKVRNLYNAKYKTTYSNRYYVIENDHIKYTRILWTYSGRKQRATCYVYIKVSLCSDYEGSPQLRSCLHDKIINAAPRTGKKLTNWNFIESVHI